MLGGVVLGHVVTCLVKLRGDEVCQLVLCCVKFKGRGCRSSCARQSFVGVKLCCLKLWWVSLGSEPGSVGLQSGQFLVFHTLSAPNMILRQRHFMECALSCQKRRARTNQQD